MHFALVVLVELVAICLVATVSAFTVQHASLDLDNAILGCDEEIDEPGEYLIVGDKNASPDSCQALFTAAPDEYIEISVSVANFNCSLHPFYAILFDGVHGGSSFFPPMANQADERKKQFKAVCGNQEDFASYQTSTNALTILHTLNNFDGLAMKFHIRFLRNSQPCNVVMPFSSGLHVFESESGEWQNCSLLLQQPARIALDYVRVGHLQSIDSYLQAARILPKSAQKNLLDDLSSTCHMQSTADLLDIAPFPYKRDAHAVRLCGSLNYADGDPLRYAIETCGPAIVNLRSSGRYRNRVLVSWSETDSKTVSQGSNANNCLSLVQTNIANLDD